MANIEGWYQQDFSELESTNTTALELSSNPPAGRYVITARRQTRGKARRGRNWVSLDGNLLMSLALPVEAKKPAELIFIVSLSLLQTIAAMSPGIDVKLKWPNDVLVNGAKISGILLEKGSGKYIIIGIGVNITAAPSSQPELIYSVTSLFDAGIKIDRCEFLRAYLKQFNRNLDLWSKQGFAPLRKAWLDNCRGLGEPITVHTEKETKKGIFTGIGADGALLLERNGQTEKIYAGDVFYI